MLDSTTAVGQYTIGYLYGDLWGNGCMCLYNNSTGTGLSDNIQSGASMVIYGGMGACACTIIVRVRVLCHCTMIGTCVGFWRDDLLIWHVPG